jgi:tetratricopeptide (TPR) repeat protein
MEIRAVLGEVETFADAYAPPEECHACMLLALRVFYGHPEHALCHARRALAVAVEIGDEELRLKAHHRLYVVLVFTGLAAGSEAAGSLSTLLQHCERAGDVRLHYTTMANQAVWLMELGAYPEARRILTAAEHALPRSARGERLNLHANLGEIAFHCGQYDEALAQYERAVTYFDRGTRDFLRDVVHAGLGLASLEVGRLDQARTCLAVLREWPDWFFDPMMIIRFQTTWDARHGKVRSALSALEDAGHRLRGRYPSIWIRLETFRAQLAHRHGRPISQRNLVAALDEANRLGLGTRARALDQLLAH